MGIFPNWNSWWHKPATKQMEQLPCMPVSVDLLSMQSIAVALGSGKSTFTRVLIESLLAIVRVSSLLPGSSSWTSSRYAWNWRVSGTQNFWIWFSPGSVHCRETKRGHMKSAAIVGRCSRSWQSQLQGVSATVNMALEWPWPQKALCVEDLLLILDANIGGEKSWSSTKLL